MSHDIDDIIVRTCTFGVPRGVYTRNILHCMHRRDRATCH